MNIEKQIESLEATIEEKAARMQDIADKAASESRSMDDAEAEEFDTLKGEIERLEADCSRMKTLQRIRREKDMEGAQPAENMARRNAERSFSGQPLQHAKPKDTEKLAPGIAFARAARCLALSHMEHRDATVIAQSLYQGREDIIKATRRLVTKAAVEPATTTDPTWAGALIGTESSAFADFVEFLRPQTIIGKFGTNGVPSLRRVPFRTALVGQTTGGDGYWVGEGDAKPLTKFDFTRTVLEPLKVANIAVATMEVIRDSSPSAEAIIRDQLAAALRQRLDEDFVDPAKAAVAGVSPASVLNGATSVPSSGIDATAVRADIQALFDVFIADNNAPTSGVWIMSASTALALSSMLNPLGQPEFPSVGMMGGTLYGMPVIVSESMPSDSSGSVVALVNAQDIYLADEGGIDIDMSTEASLQMDDAPDNPTTATTVLVSLWQRNLVGFRAERTINWARRRDSSVAYLTGVAWSA